MVRIRIDLDHYGHLISLNMQGHAGSVSGGSNLACAALSLLVRSIARLLESRLGEDFAGQAVGTGELSFDIYRKVDSMNQWFLGVTETLVQGLNDIDREYPDSILLTIRKKGEEYGT